MKIVLTLSVALATVVWPAPASANHRGFFYGDTILFSRVVLDPTDPDQVARCDYLVRGEASRIWFGYVIEIPAPYQDGRHSFTVTDGLMGFTVGADFDVTFTPDLGTCLEQPVSATRFHNPGDEHGVVPAGIRYAIFTMRSTETFGATFTIEIPAVD